VRGELLSIRETLFWFLVLRFSVLGSRFFLTDLRVGMPLNVLHITLDSHSSQREELPPVVEQQFAGGRGAASWLLATMVSPDVSPTSTANALILSAGPVAGRAPGVAGGLIATTRSPITGILAHSWAIGHWGTMLQQAGFDIVTLTGQSADWCYILIDDGAITFHVADSLAGLDTFATAQAIRQTHGGEWSVAAIGPAGEAGVAYASIVVDGRHAAEPAGTGVVMAKKRVKAIAVRGSALQPADKTRTDAVLASINKRVTGNEQAAAFRRDGGSLAYTSRAIEIGLFSYKNGQEGELPHAQALDRGVWGQRARREGHGCAGCLLECATSYQRRNGEPMAYPELEAIAGFGGACGIANPDTIIIANDLCVRLGLDVAAASAALAFMMECQERGLSRAGTLAWGDGDAVVATLRRLGQRQEKRDVLSLGAGEMQDVYYGSGTFAPQVKGMALPGFDPRALPELALCYAVSPIGSDHRYAMSYEKLAPELPTWLMGSQSTPALQGTVPRLIWHERFAAAIDAAGVCRRMAMMAYQISPSEVTELITAATGRVMSGIEVAKLGERIVTFERLLSLRYESDADSLPHRWVHDPLESGGALGKLPVLEDLLAEYYRRHGWNEAGEPTAARLAELGIDLPATLR
jgi:aldehyde:ferredoxin oxidoreductase